MHTQRARQPSFYENEDSFELDGTSEDPDYDDPDSYNSAVKDGGDINSTYDGANPLAGDEYIKDESLDTDVEKLSMHVTSADELEVDKVDEILAHTSEDDRDYLDEAGYPKNDRPMK